MKQKLMASVMLAAILISTVMALSEDVNAIPSTIYSDTHGEYNLINASVNKSAVLTVREKAERGIFHFLIWDFQLPPPFNNYFGVFLALVGLWALLAGVIFVFLDPIVKALVKKTKTEIDDKILAVVKKPTIYIIMLYGIVSTLEIMPIPGDIAYFIIQIYYILVILILGYTAHRLFKDVILYVASEWAKRTETKLDDIVLPIVEKIGIVTIWIFVLLTMLGYLGIDITMLVAGVGVAGLVIAFAAQDTLSNFFAGIFLLADRPFDVGDVIMLEDGTYCRIQRVGMRSTVIYDLFNHQVITIPNNQMASQRIVNVSRPNPQIKVGFRIGVSYDAEPEKVKRVIKEVLESTEHIIHDKNHGFVINLDSFDDSAITYFIKFWVDHYDNQWSVAASVREKLYYRFKEEGIEIPYPQQVVWFANDLKVRERRKVQKKQKMDSK